MHMRRPTFFSVAAQILRACKKIMPAHAIFVVLIAVLVVGSSVDAATVRKQQKKQNPVLQTFGLIGDGFKEFGASIADGYRELGKDVASIMPWNKEKSRVYATQPEVIAPAPVAEIPEAPEVEVDIDISEFIPLPSSENREESALRPIYYTGGSSGSADTYITNITAGMGDDEIKTLVAQMLDSALGTSLVEEDDGDDTNDPASFLNGLIARGVVDLSGATIKGLESYQQKTAPLTIRDSTGNYKRHTVVSANEGGVSNNWSVGGDLEVKKDVTVTGAATFQSGLTAEKSVTLDTTLTVAGNATLGDDGTEDSINLKGTSTLYAGLLASANNKWDIGSQTEAFKDLYTSGSIYTQDITVLGTCTGCGGGGSSEWTDGGSVIYLADSSDDVGIGTTTPAGRLGVNGSLFIAGATTLGDASGDTVTIHGSSTFQNAAGVLGNFFVGDATSDTFTANASSTFNGQASFDSHITLGTASDENLVVNATSTFRAGITFNGELTAGTNNTYNIGSPSNAWKDVYASGTIHLGFGPSGESVLVIDASGDGGDLGIGSSTPEYGLSVGNGYDSYFGGNTIVGDSSSDSLTVNATTTFNSGLTLNAALSAGTNNAYNLGSPSNAWGGLYVSGTTHIGGDPAGGAPATFMVDATNGAVGISSSSVNGQNFTFAVGNGYNSYFGGGVTIGDSSSDTLTVNATSTFESGITINGAITVDTNKTFSIGSPSNALKD